MRSLYDRRKNIHKIRREYFPLIFALQIGFVFVLSVVILYFVLTQGRNTVSNPIVSPRRSLVLYSNESYSSFSNDFYEDYYGSLSNIVVVETSSVSLESSSSSSSSNNGSEGDACPIKSQTFTDETKNSRCDYVKNTAGCMDNYMFYFFYCGLYPPFYENTWAAYVIFFVIAVFLVLLFFYLIADTTDVYFSPSIIKICEYLKLPDSLAGVTLLAFGNGSPDLFSILAGLVSDNTSLALSAPIGAGVFVSGVVFGTVILAAPPFTVANRSFLRDTLFYVLAISAVFLNYLLRFTIIYAGVFLICLYIVYVLTVVGGRYCFANCIKPYIDRRDRIKKEREKQREIRNRVEMEKKKSPTESTHLIQKVKSPETEEEDSKDFPVYDGEEPSSSGKGKGGEKDELEIVFNTIHEVDKKGARDYRGGWNENATPVSAMSEEATKNMFTEATKMLEQRKKEKLRNLRDDEEDDEEEGVPLPSYVPDLPISGGGAINLMRGFGDFSPSTPTVIDVFGAKTPIEMLIQEDYIDRILEERKERRRRRHARRIEQSISFPEDGRDPEDPYETDEDDEDSSYGDVEDISKQSKVAGCCQKVDEFFGWSEQNFVEKVIFVIFGWWTRIIRDFTNPRSEREEWNKFFAIFSPCFGTMFISWTFFRLMGIFSMDYLAFNIAWFSINLILGIVLGAIVFFTTKRNRPPPLYNFMFIFLAFFSSVCWIFNSADVLVNTLALAGELMGVNPAFLGLTILAWGNSFPDWVANVIIARKGFPQMSVGACFGEPLLNSLIGVGTLFTWMSVENLVKYGTPCYPITRDPSLVIVFMTLIGQTIMSTTVITCMRFKVRGLKRIYGCVLICLYCFSLTLCIIAVFDHDGVGWFFSQIRLPFDAHKACSLVQSWSSLSW